MNAEEWAALYRVRAAAHRVAAARADMAAAAVLAAQGLRRVTDAIVASERREIAEHPDLVHLDAQMTGYYER